MGVQQPRFHLRAPLGGGSHRRVQKRGIYRRFVSRAAGGMWGNIIFGGGIGAIIDHNKGNGYNYPEQLPVVMGKSVVVDRKDHGSEPAPVTPVALAPAPK